MRRRWPAIAVALIASTAAAAAADCAVPGESAIEAARSNEFRFTVERSGGTECFLTGDSVIASASSDEAIACDVTLFADREFHPDWSLSNAEMLGPVEDFDRQPTGRITFLLAAEAGETRVVTLKSVTLSGPDCDHWPDAFSGQSAEPDAGDEAESTEADG